MGRRSKSRYSCKKRVWKVYRHINKITGDMYIGITTKQDFTERWGKDGKGYKYSYFYRAITEYGWENFDHEVLTSDGFVPYEEGKQYTNLLRFNARDAQSKEQELIYIYKAAYNKQIKTHLIPQEIRDKK